MGKSDLLELGVVAMECWSDVEIEVIWWWVVYFLGERNMLLV